MKPGDFDAIWQRLEALLRNEAGRLEAEQRAAPALLLELLTLPRAEAGLALRQRRFHSIGLVQALLARGREMKSRLLFELALALLGYLHRRAHPAVLQVLRQEAEAGLAAYRGRSRGATNGSIRERKGSQRPSM